MAIVPQDHGTRGASSWTVTRGMGLYPGRGGIGRPLDSKDRLRAECNLDCICVRHGGVYEGVEDRPVIRAHEECHEVELPIVPWALTCGNDARRRGVTAAACPSV